MASDSMRKGYYQLYLKSEWTGSVLMADALSSTRPRITRAYLLPTSRLEDKLVAINQLRVESYFLAGTSNDRAKLSFHD